MTNITPISPLEKFRYELRELWDTDTYATRYFLDGGQDDAIHDELSERLWRKDHVLNTPNGAVYLEAQYGGEGQGEEHWHVYRYEPKEGDPSYFRIDGYYASWDGADYSGEQFKQVWPRKVERIEYV